MRSNYTSPVNVGSEEMVSINDLADMAMAIAGKRLEKRHIPGPVGVRGRNSDNRLIRRELGWAPSQSLYDGLETTYRWIETQTRSNSSAMRAGVTHHVAAQRILPLRPASHEHADADINLAAIRPHPVAELAANRF
jgi:hypothetical protein